MQLLSVILILLAFVAPARAATFGKVVPIGGHVSDLAYDNRRGVVYIANFTAGRIEVLSTADNTLRSPVYVPPQPGTIALSPDNRFLVIGHFTEGTAGTPAVTVLDLDANQRRTLTLASSPVAVAFGGGSNALIVTRKDFQLLEPLTGTLTVLASGGSLTVKDLPVAAPTFPPEILQASTGVSGDGEMVYILAQGANAAAIVQFRPADAALGVISVKAEPELGPRVVSVNRDGTRYIAGWALVTPSVINLAQFPYPTGDLNIGTHAFDWVRNRIYAQVPNNPQSSGTPAASSPASSDAGPVLHVLDTDNLTVRERIRIRENLAGRSVFSPDMKVLYSASDSGVTIFALEEFDRAPRVASVQEDLLFQSSACDRRMIVREFDVVDPAGNRTDFSISGGRPGISISSSSSTTPARVRVEIDPTAFQNAKGTTTVHLQLNSNGAVNMPAPVRLLINTKEPEQRGALVNVSGKLVDLLADPVRNRVYVLRQDRNAVLVLNTANYRQIGVLRTGNTPTQMAITRDNRFLIIGNDNSQIARVYDLENLQESAPIVFPPGHYPRSIAVASGDILASVRSAASPEHKIDRINFEARTATELPSLGIYKNDVNVDTVLAASPSGRMVLVAMPDGKTMLYDSEARTFVAARSDMKTVGGALAAVSDDFFVVDDNLLNRSLVPVSKLESGTGQSSGFAVLASDAMRTTTPGAATAGVIQRFGSEAERIRPTRMVESPLNPRTLRTPDVGLIGQTILPFIRTLAPLPNQTSVLSLSVSGLSVLAWDYDAALLQPSLQTVTNLADGSRAVAPGSLISVQGSNLAASSEAAGEVPVPTTLGEACLTVNGVLLPLFFASPDSIRAQLPYTVDGTARMLLRTPGGTSNVLDFTIRAAAPAVFRESGDGSGTATVYRAANAGRVTFSNPIHPEDVIQIYLTGLGKTTPSVEPGYASPADPIAQAVLTPEVVLGDAPLELHFAGLVPNEVGVYAIVGKVPWWAPAGTSVPLTVRQGDQATTLQVRVVK